MNASTAIRSRPRGRGDGVDLVHRQGQRLLAQHVLAGLEGPDRPLGVEVVRQRDVDDVDLGRGEERLVRAERPGDPVLRCESRGPTGIAAGDCDQFAPLASGDATDQPWCDATGAEDRPAKGSHATDEGPGTIVTIGATTA